MFNSSTHRRKVLEKHTEWMVGKPSWVAFSWASPMIYSVMSYYWNRTV